MTQQHAPTKRFLAFWYYHKSLVSVEHAYAGSFDSLEEVLGTIVDGDTLEVLDIQMNKMWLFEDVNANTTGVEAQWVEAEETRPEAN